VALRPLLAVQQFLRKALHLPTYSEDSTARLTGRAELSYKLVEAQEPAQMVLDVGCSSGWLEKSLFQRQHVRVIGIDPSAEAVERARAFFPSGDFRQASALSLPFESASFDGVIMFEAIEHIPKGTELQALREIRRVARAGAWFLLSTPFAHPAAILLDPAWYFGHRHYSKQKLEELFTQAGFSVEKMFIRGGLWELDGMIALYCFKWTLRSEIPFKNFVERGRRREFLGERGGFSNIFVIAKAV